MKRPTAADPMLRISAIVDARFSLIVDGETTSSRARRGGAQALRLNVAQSSTISLKRRPFKGTPRLVLGLDRFSCSRPLPGRRRRPDRACTHVWSLPSISMS